MTDPYYQDDLVTLWHGDCLENTEWTSAKTLFTDPPYGRGHTQNGDVRPGRRVGANRHDMIKGDKDTTTRDAALALWGDRPAIIFGDPMIAPPSGTKLFGAFVKGEGAGMRGAIAGHRRDVEALYWLGPWPAGFGGRSSVYRTRAHTGNPSSQQARFGHQHCKPLDVCEELAEGLPPGPVADPFAGAGSLVIAARNLGHPVLAVEWEERHCETIALRCSAGVLDLGTHG